MLIEENPQFTSEVEFIRQSHGSQTRKHGGPYYLHPVAVANIVRGRFKITEANFILAALYHDLLEDTQVTREEIILRSSLWVANVVSELTKPKGSKYTPQEVYGRLGQGSLPARIIKVADRIHNISEMELASPEFVKRYIADTEVLIVCLEGTPFLDELKGDFEKIKGRHV